MEPISRDQAIPAGRAGKTLQGKRNPLNTNKHNLTSKQPLSKYLSSATPCHHIDLGIFPSLTRSQNIAQHDTLGSLKECKRRHTRVLKGTLHFWAWATNLAQHRVNYSFHCLWLEATTGTGGEGGTVWCFKQAHKRYLEMIHVALSPHDEFTSRNWLSAGAASTAIPK